MSKHTEGDWIAETIEELDEIIIYSGNDDRQKIIARLPLILPWGYAQSEANGDLIAAAPAMEKALEDIEKALHALIVSEAFDNLTEEQYKLFRGLDEARMQGRAALMAARGEV